MVAALAASADFSRYSKPPPLGGGAFTDEGVSGARLDRPALDRLRDLAAEGVMTG